MDIDEIKESWRQTNIKPDINEEKIRKMIGNEGVSAYNALRRIELVNMIGSLLLIPIGVLLFESYIQWFYILGCFFYLLWTINKYLFLREIDLANTDIVTISRYLFKYKKMVVQEIVGGSVWFVLFMLVLGVFLYRDSWGQTMNPLHIALIIGIASVIGGYVVFWLYKSTYWKNIKTLQKSLKELEQYEEN